MFRFISILAIVILLASCKKDKNAPPAPPLKQLKIVGPNGAVEHIDINYDQLNRVTTIFRYEGDSGRIVPPDDTVYHIVFHYAGNSMLPSMIDYSDISPMSYGRHYLSYTTSGQLQRDSFWRSFDNTSHLLYYIFPDNKMVTTDNSKLFDTVELQNGNAAWQSYKYNTYYEKNTYEYDDKVNPANKMNIAPVFHVIWGTTNALALDWGPMNQNNVTRRTTTTFTPGHFTQTNVYDDNDWLLKTVRTYSSLTIPATVTYKY